MNKYRCLTFQDLDFKNYTITPIQEKNMESIRVWRNAQLDVLRQKKHLSINDQKHYYATVIRPLFRKKKPSQLLFCFLKEGNCIGYGGIVHINWEDLRGEVSFLLNTERTKNQKQYTHDFLSFLNLISVVAFDHLKFNRLVTETFEFRTHHIDILESFGFSKEGELREHVQIRNNYVSSLLHGLLKKEYNER